MTSDEINEAINRLEDAGNLTFSAFDGKVIPYIGWFWRSVDFDEPQYNFGVIPTGVEDNDVPLVGFMESNKWGYPTIEASTEQTAEIRLLIEKALSNNTPDDYKAVNMAIQRLAEPFEFHGYSVGEEDIEWAVVDKKGRKNG